MPVAFRFHARALAALGRDLVTNDIVAVVELVKNSYDALATSVTVRIRNTSADGRVRCLQVEDDGHGMDYATIRDVWRVIATPFRREQPVSRTGSMTPWPCTYSATVTFPAPCSVNSIGFRMYQFSGWAGHSA